MAIINTRSPFYKTKTSTGVSYGIMELYIWKGIKTSPPVDPTYTVRKSVLNGSNSYNFEYAELVRDELNIFFDGTYDNAFSTASVWVKAVLTSYDSSGTIIGSPSTYTDVAFDGYNYFEDGSPIFIEPSLLLTNREIFSLKGNTVRVPIYTGTNPSIVFYKNGEIVYSEVISEEDGSDNQIKYLSIYGDDANWDTFKERVQGSKNAIFEDSKCLQDFFKEHGYDSIDRIDVSGSYGIIETVIVKEVEECKYEPVKVTFVNKFGALQDMHFFKKSVENMVVEKESYKSGGYYNINSHVNKDFNVIGKESVSLSSGFLSEDYNEVFKQLLLSEQVWITKINTPKNIQDTRSEEQVLPINVKTSDITYKTSLNDKLVEYTIEFDKSYDTINTVR